MPVTDWAKANQSAPGQLADSRSKYADKELNEKRPAAKPGEAKPKGESLPGEANPKGEKQPIETQPKPKAQ